MTELSLAHAIEKVTFRLGLRSAGYITLAEIFVQFPLSFELIDDHVTQIADGRTLLKDEAGEHCAIHFPEYSAIGEAIATNNDCPVCLGPAPNSVTIAGEEVAAPLICDACYRNIGRLVLPEKNSSFSDKIKSFFVEAEDDQIQTTIMEHEICFKALSIGGKLLTHTAIAAQTRYGMADVKDHLQTMGARRYVKLGLTPSQDAVAYSFPDKLLYPEPYFHRFKETMDFLTGRAGHLPKSSHSSNRPKLEIGVKSRASSNPGVSFQRRSRSADSPNSSSESSSFKIRVKKKNEHDAPDPSPSTPLRISVRASERFKQPQIPRTKPILSVSPTTPEPALKTKPEPAATPDPAPEPIPELPVISPPKRSYAVADPHPEENVFADSADAALSPEAPEAASDEIAFTDSADASLDDDASLPDDEAPDHSGSETAPDPIETDVPSFEIDPEPEAIPERSSPKFTVKAAEAPKAQDTDAQEHGPDHEDYDDYEQDGGHQAGEFIGTPID